MITAVDVGATKTLIAQFKDNMEPINHIRFETPSIAADFVRTLVRHLKLLNDVSALSVGLPGQISDDGDSILYCGNLPWRNVPLKKMLAEHFECPIYLQNDAAMAGLGEINALKPVPKLGFYITIGTGIGSAIILNGRLEAGLNRSEAGHMILKNGESWQEWEDLASGRAIVNHFHQLAQDLTEPAQWQWLAENLAQGFGPIIAILQPNAIVIGGGVGRHFEHFHGLLTEKLHRRLPNYIAVPPMFGSHHADDAVLYGCYYHATHQQNR